LVQPTPGTKAIHTYLTSACETRFIQSFKSHIASRIFDETRIFGHGYKSEDLLAFGLALIGLEDDLRPWLAQSPGE
jgi:hypothetical protein